MQQSITTLTFALDFQNPKVTVKLRTSVVLLTIVSQKKTGNLNVNWQHYVTKKQRRRDVSRWRGPEM